jgi:N-Acetylglucosaminyltransferase-IV (GnT-IV) conserved region
MCSLLFKHKSVVLAVLGTLALNLVISNFLFSLIPREQHTEQHLLALDAQQKARAQQQLHQEQLTDALTTVVKLKMQLLQTLTDRNCPVQSDILTENLPNTPTIASATTTTTTTTTTMATTSTTADSDSKPSSTFSDIVSAPVLPGMSSTPSVSTPSASTPLPPLPTPAPDPSRGPSPSDSEKPYLLVAIATVMRPGNADYLSETLSIMEAQFVRDPAHPLYQRIRVLVMNMHDRGQHEVFERVKNRFSGVEFQFVERTDTSSPNEEKHEQGTVPANVQKQTRDLVHLLRQAAGQSSYLLIIEDDFYTCPHALNTLQYALTKLHKNFPNWITLKISYGFNGIVMQNGRENGNDVSTFADYLFQHRARRPPDHLYTEWAAGETTQSHSYKNDRPHIAFRYNLLHHAGGVSTLGHEDVGYPKCFEPLVYPVLFEVDAFKPDLCGHDDIWPCPPQTQNSYFYGAAMLPPQHTQT